MKKFILAIVAVAMLTSCTTYHRYQICKVSSELPTSSTGAYEYKNSACNVVYDFWSEGGDVYFIITNNTNDFLNIDLSKSFLIKNGIAYDYFLNRTSTTSASSITSKSASASGTALGFWNNYAYKVPGSITATTSNSIGSQKTTAITFEEVPVVVIPPHASKAFSEYSIMRNRYQDCNLYEAPSKAEEAKMSFNLANSPVAFTNYICYRVGNNTSDQFIENNFYISEVSNQHKDATFHKEKIGCSSDTYQKTQNVFIKTSPKEFYITYMARSQKKASFDVKKINKQPNHKSKKANSKNDDLYNK